MTLGLSHVVEQRVIRRVVRINEPFGVQTDHYARLQRRLQQKDTRSATRRRIALAQRERRLKLNTNHCISKQIVANHPHAFIGIEDLTHIRERTKRRRYRRKGQQLVPVSPQARKANRHASQWAFAKLQACVAYKAALAGSVCVKVDADYTSQACPRCGFTSTANRNGGGLLFVCRQCHYALHADLVGARNILLRALVIRQDWVTTGQLSDAPDVTDREDIRCTPIAVCRIAVESGHKLLPFQGSESLTPCVAIL